MQATLKHYAYLNCVLSKSAWKSVVCTRSPTTATDDGDDEVDRRAVSPHNTERGATPYAVQNKHVINTRSASLVPQPSHYKSNDSAGVCDGLGVAFAFWMPASMVAASLSSNPSTISNTRHTCAPQQARSALTLPDPGDRTNLNAHTVTHHNPHAPAAILRQTWDGCCCH